MMHNLTHGKPQIKIHFVKTLDGLIINSCECSFQTVFFSVLSWKGFTLLKLFSKYLFIYSVLHEE